MTLANQLLEIRTQLGKTQKQMADIIGVTTEHYWRYEKGKSMPTLQGLQTISNRFRVTFHIYPKDK